MVDSQTGILQAVIDRYLDHILDGRFRIYLFDKHGSPVHWSSGANAVTLGSGPDDVLLSDIGRRVEEGLAGYGPAPISAGKEDGADSQIAYIRLSAGDRPKLKWLFVRGPRDVDEAELLRFCRLAANLLEDRILEEEKLRRLRHTVLKQDAIIDHISDGLLVLDRYGILQYCNEPASQILKINLQTSIGRPISEVLDFEPAINQVFAKGEGYIDREHQIESPTLSLHVVDTALPIRDEAGEIISVVNTFRRIERVKQLSYRMMMDRPLYGFSDLLGHSATLKAAVTAGQKAAKTDTSVVLYGESGTGKELFAQAIHSDGARHDCPFIAINCAAIPRDLVESELFGYTAGSFTGADTAGRPGKFELASGGTLFLDEIAEMPLEVQAKLLRVLQEQRVLRIGAAHSIPVDVRIIAASNKRLKDMVSEGSFRDDLFYRLSVIEIDIPSLRDRSGDIGVLIEHFLNDYSQRANRTPITLGAHAMQQLVSYDWPGNVRQLQNIMERLVSLSDADVVDEIPSAWFVGGAARDAAGASAMPDGTLFSMAQWERHAIVATLNATGFNVTRAAEALGVSRPTLYAKLKKFGLERSSVRA